jgi:hypothetical protein
MMTVHTCQTFAQAGFERRLRGFAWSSTVIFGAALHSLYREARLSCCSALHIARVPGPACAAAETQEIAWQGRAATWGGLAPEHWTRAASLKRPFENRRQMPFTEQSRQAEYYRLTASLVWARTLGNVRRDHVTAFACVDNETRLLS